MPLEVRSTKSTRRSQQPWAGKEKELRVQVITSPQKGIGVNAAGTRERRPKNKNTGEKNDAIRSGAMIAVRRILPLLRIATVSSRILYGANEFSH